ncbi:hypothetical protein EDD11_000204 [Mortierella claussenii]|nr:hypothetical protein EDD11_000204 [Mortierella claussenii]
MTNTWITRFRPEAMNPIDGNANNNNNNDSNGDGDSSKGNKGGLSVGAVLGLGFVFTLAIVGGVFWLLVRRRKRRTRNTMARENMDQYTTSRAAAEASSRKHFRSGFLELLGVGAIAKRERGDGEHKRPDSKRYSEFSLRSHHPQSIMERMAELGYSPMNLGYPEQVVRQGTGSVPISSYAYPNQACAHTERWRGGKHETQIVFHDMTAAQKEALRLAMEEEYHRQQPPKHELLQFDDDGFF